MGKSRNLDQQIYEYINQLHTRATLGDLRDAKMLAAVHKDLLRFYPKNWLIIPIPTCEG